jgi:hypothetical protein
MIIGLKNKRHEKVLETKEGKEIKIRIACKSLIVKILVGITLVLEMPTRRAKRYYQLIILRRIITNKTYRHLGGRLFPCVCLHISPFCRLMC